MTLLRFLPMLIVLLAALLHSAPARADYCGGDGERACNVTERIPSCDMNLVEAGGRCVRALCGAEGQRPCGPTERILFDFVLKLPVPQICDKNLVNDLLKGQCVHPPCGREGQRECTVLERIPSCDVNLFAAGGTCRRPADCGREGQPACAMTVRGPLFKCDANLVPTAQGCKRAGTADTQTAAAPPVAAAPPPPPAPARTAPPPPPAPARTAPPPPPPAPVAAAPAGAMEANTDRPGGDLLGFELAQADPALCQAHCSANAQCVAWTFVRPGVAGPNARCFAKNVAVAAVPNACCTSGVKAGAVAAAAPPPPPPTPAPGLLRPLR